MTNALATPPPAPEMTSENMQPMAAPPTGGMPGGAPSGAGGPPQPMPAPSHAQAVATLRHFDAIERELKALNKNPDLGKTNQKSAIIDSVTRLVGARIMTPAQAIMQLGTVPEQPIAQRKWVMQHAQQAEQAKDGILDHHRMAHAGTPEEMHAPGNPDDHLSTISSVLGMYGKK